MSGGLNGAALSAYTNFLCDFDTLVKKRTLTERSTNNTTLSVNIHTLITTESIWALKNSFRFVYTVWLAKMCKTQNVCWKASIEFKFLRLLNLQSPFIERLNNLSCPESYIPFTMRQFKIRITYRASSSSGNRSVEKKSTISIFNNLVSYSMKMQEFNT